VTQNGELGMVIMSDPAQTGRTEPGLLARLSSIRFDKWTALDLIERIFVTVLFAHFAGRMFVAYHAEANIGIVLLVISEVLVMLLVLTRGRTEKISVNPTDWILAFAGTTAPLLAVPSLQNPIISAQLCVGLMLMGLCLQVSAKVILWTSFGIVAANRGVKIHGPYRFIRHPMYAGYVVTHIGFLLGFPSLRNAILYLAALAIQIARLKREERILMLDPAYQAYSSRVRYRLLPGLF
jgi:protein-S-isoprenylcysteine O-methyltransferase Ste14